MSKEKPKVLVVEDEWLLLQAISKKLELNGITAVPYGSGNEAINYLHNLTDLSDLPDVIWLDYQLKDMDGLEFIDKLKKISRCAQIPVIVVSNSASEAKVHTMLALGVREYILKAKYRLDEIIVTVRKIIADNNIQEK